MSRITENVCIKLNIFYEYLAKLLAPNVKKEERKLSRKMLLNKRKKKPG